MVSLITNNVLDAAQSRFTPLGYELMWVVNTALTDMYYDIKYISNIPDQPNKVEIRFQEFFPYEDRWTGDNSDYLPANFTLVQHDHVIITVNDDCQIQEWDQVADFVEANAVTVAFGTIIFENGGLENLLANYFFLQTSAGCRWRRRCFLQSQNIIFCLLPPPQHW
jgi:hypothetical protein